MIGEYKGIFHSTLVSFGDAYVTIKSDIMKSKQAGKPDFVVVEHDGQDQFLNLENAACASVFRGKKGQSTAIRASGSRKDAKIEIVGADGTIKTSEASPARLNASEASDQPTARQWCSKWSQGASLALETVHGLRFAHDAEYKDQKMTDAQFQVLVSGLLIGLDRKGYIDSMEVASKKAEEEPEGEESW